MYAIVEAGGKQYRVEKGDVLDVELMKGEEGDSVELGRVLLVADEEGTWVGNPLVEGAVVTGTILEHGREKKKIIFRYKAKSRYRVKRGHRQPFTRVKIESIEL